MAIYSQTWGDINTASSRLRVFNIQPHIENYFIGSPDDTPSYDMSNYKSGYKKGDVLIMQKIPMIDELRRAKKEGAKVIYDIDDNYIQRKEFAEMIKEADLVTVDTEEKAKLIPGAVVIPDSLDWDGTVKKEYGNGKIIGWTGYGNNSAYLNDIELPKESKLRLVTSPDWLKHYKDNQAQCRPWSLEMVDKYLSECDFGIYYLPNGQFEQVKGMHKLLKNMAIGLPTYTSPMPDYVKAFKEAGLGAKYIVKENKDWKNLDLVKDYDDIDKARAYALTYSAKNIAKLWEKAIEKVLKEK